MGNDRKAKAKKLVNALLKKGVRAEKIAVDLGVSHNSIIRWASGKHAPHPGAMAKLERLVARG